MAPRAPYVAGEPAVKQPSELQVAFALALCRSKPDGISIRDYVLQLRAHIKRSHEIEVNSESRHLDSVAFWRDQYEKAEAKCQELQALMVELQRVNEISQLQNQRESSVASSSVPSKRKRGTGKQAAVKNAKLAKPMPKSIAEGFVVPGSAEVVGDDLQAIDGMGTHGTVLSQQLYSMHKLFKNPGYNKLEREHLCFHSIQACRAIGSVISAVCAGQHEQTIPERAPGPYILPPAMAATKAHDELASAIQGSARAYTSILIALQKISQGDEQRRLSGLVIYESVKMFQSILTNITESALSTAKANVALEEAEPSSNSKKLRAKATKSSRPTSTSRNLSQLLMALLSYLEDKDPLHRELFEGFMFVLLDRIGKRLFVCTFDRERSATIEGDIDPPEHLASSASGPRQELEKRALRLEVPCLVSILEKAMTLAPQHLATRMAGVGRIVRSATSSGRRPTGKAAASAGKLALSQHAKERLQQTLVNCMFGEDQPDEFSDCLRMPARLGTVPAPPKVEEQDVAEWFKEEVWRLVGWEILGTEDGRDSKNIGYR